MPRNSGGTYSLPAGNPVVTGTTIASVWANTTMSDIATALTGSLARNGDGGMTGQFLASSGAVGAPGVSWSSETTSGWYRAAVGNFRFAIAGSDIITVATAGVTIPTLNVTTLTVSGILSAGGFNATAAGVPANGVYLPSANTIGFSTNSIAHGSLNATGNWTLLAPSSGPTLTVNGPSAGPLAVFNSTTATADYIQIQSSGAAIGNIGNGSVFGGVAGDFVVAPATGSLRLFAASNGLAATIGTGGNVTIAAPSSGVALTVSGTVAVSSGLSVTGTNSGIVLASLSTSGSASVGLGNTADGVADGLTIGYVGSAGGFSPAKGYIHYSGTSLVWFNTGYTQTMSLDSSGNLVCVGNVTAFSDVRLKDDVETIRGALGLVRELRGITYARKDNGARGTGLIAQDVQTVLPEAVATDENGMLSVAYGNVTGLLVEAIKELNGKLDRAGIY